jgi:hypothetical protein
MAGRGPGSAAVGSRVPAGRFTTPTAAHGLAQERFCGPAGTRPGVAQQRTADAQSRPTLPVPSCWPRERCPHAGDHRRGPHKTSHTAPRSTSTVNCWTSNTSRHPRRLPVAAPMGRPLAAALLGGGRRPRDRLGAGQRLVGDGEQVVDVPASWPPGCGSCQSDTAARATPDDAVSVAITARSVPQLRQVAVEDQATVLHLLTKGREDLVAARTQTINRLHRLLMDLVPRRQTKPPGTPGTSTAGMLLPVRVGACLVSLPLGRRPRSCRSSRDGRCT